MHRLLISIYIFVANRRKLLKSRFTQVLQTLIFAYNNAPKKKIPDRGSKEEVLLLNILGEDKDIYYNNLKVLTETYLDIFSEESSKKIKVISLEESIKY